MISLFGQQIFCWLKTFFFLSVLYCFSQKDLWFQAMPWKEKKYSVIDVNLCVNCSKYFLWDLEIGKYFLRTRFAGSRSLASSGAGNLDFLTGNRAGMGMNFYNYKAPLLAPIALYFFPIFLKLCLIRFFVLH